MTAMRTSGATNPTMAENICKVVSHRAVNAEYRLLVVEAPEIALGVEPGQFFHLACPVADGVRPFLRRPMSIYDIDRKSGRLSFLYKVQGKGTRALATLQTGDTLNALGPLGHGFRLEAKTRHVLLIGRGVGLATLAPLTQAAVAQGAKVTAVLSARAPEFLMSQDLLSGYGAQLVTVTDTDRSSDVSRLSMALQQMHHEDPFDWVATCGSNRLFRMARGLCADWGIPGQVALEARMGCGTGMCLACVVQTKNQDGTEAYRTVCVDGPVFGIEEATAW